MLSQSKKYHYRRLERDITQDDDNSSPELTRSRSTDDAGDFALQLHQQMGHRRTRSDGSSMSSSRSSDENFEKDMTQVHPRIHVSTSVLEREDLTHEPTVGPQLQASVSSPNKLRVSFVVKEVSDSESAGGVTPVTEGETSRTDLSSDPELSAATSGSSRKVSKKKTKGKLAKLLHLHRAQHVEEDVSNLGPSSHVEMALCSALSLGFSAAPCAMPGRGSRTESSEQTGLISQQAETQEAEIQGNSDVGTEPSAMETNFRTKLKRIPLEINSKLSGEHLVGSHPTALHSFTSHPQCFICLLVIETMCCMCTVTSRF